MQEVDRPIAADPKEALANYIRELEDIHYRWYDGKQKSYKRQWQVMQTMVVVAGFGTSIIAALMREESFRGLAWGRIVLVLLPSIGALASTLLIQMKTLEMMALREKGRQTILYLVSVAKLKYAAIDDPAEISKVHQWLIEEVAALSRDQAAGFLTLAPSRIDLAEFSTADKSKLQKSA